MKNIIATQPQIKFSKEKIADFCHRHSIQQLAFFGSVLRDDFNATSDVDVLVEFAPDRVPGFIKLYSLQEELSDLLDGRKIDLVTLKSLNPRLRDKILAEVQVQYTQG